MTKILKTAAFTGAVLMAAGVLLAVIGFAAGGSSYLARSTDGFNLAGWRLGPAGFGAHTADRKELSPFQSVRAEGRYLELELRPSGDETYSAVIEYSSGLEAPECRVSGGTLEIISKWPRDLKNHGGRTYRVTVLYPVTAVFQSLSADLSVCELNIQNFQSDRTEIRTSAGDVEIADASLGIFFLNNAMGDVEIENSSAAEASISLNMGNLEGKAFDTGSLNADADMGNIEISGAMRGRTEVSVSMGNAELTPSLPPDQYFVDVSATGNHYTQGTKDAPNQIRVKASLGATHVELSD